MWPAKGETVAYWRPGFNGLPEVQALLAADSAVNRTGAERVRVALGRHQNGLRLQGRVAYAVRCRTGSRS